MLSGAKILDEWATIKQLRRGLSIARFGDGEFNIMMGGRAKLQAPSDTLAVALADIASTANDRCLVGVPRYYDGMPARKAQFWAKYRNNDGLNSKFILPVYGSAFVTRPDSVPEINDRRYYDYVRSLWDDRPVLLVEGKDQKFTKAGMLDNCASLEILKCPAENAWENYANILTSVKQTNKTTLVIASLGPTATVLCWDLSRHGYQALDLGHLSFLHEKVFLYGLTH